MQSFFQKVGMAATCFVVAVILILFVSGIDQNGYGHIVAQRSADWLVSFMAPIIRLFLFLAAIFAGFYFFLWKKVTVPMFKTGDGKDAKANPAGIVFAAIVVISILAGLSHH